MLTKRHNRSSDQLIPTVSSSIEDLSIPPLNLRNVKTYEGLSSSSASLSARQTAIDTDPKANLLVASVDIHAPTVPKLVPIPAPRQSSAFEFTHKSHKDQLNNRKKASDSPTDHEDHGGDAWAHGETDGVPLVQLPPKRVRPKSAKPKKHRPNNIDNRNVVKLLPTIAYENEQSSSGHSKDSERSMVKRRHRKHFEDHYSTQSDVSATEKNDYEMCEVSSTHKDIGRENLAFEKDDDHVQETCVDAKASDESLESAVAQTMAAPMTTTEKKSKKKIKKSHRKSKKADDAQTIGDDTNVVPTVEVFTAIIGK